MPVALRNQTPIFAERNAAKSRSANGILPNLGIIRRCSVGSTSRTLLHINVAPKPPLGSQDSNYNENGRSDGRNNSLLKRGVDASLFCQSKTPPSSTPSHSRRSKRFKISEEGYFNRYDAELSKSLPVSPRTRQRAVLLRDQSREEIFRVLQRQPPCGYPAVFENAPQSCHELLASALVPHLAHYSGKWLANELPLDAAMAVAEGYFNWRRSIPAGLSFCGCRSAASNVECVEFAAAVADRHPKGRRAALRIFQRFPVESVAEAFAWMRWLLHCNGKRRSTEKKSRQESPTNYPSELLLLSAKAETAVSNHEAWKRPVSSDPEGQLLNDVLECLQKKLPACPGEDFDVIMGKSVETAAVVIAELSPTIPEVLLTWLLRATAVGLEKFHKNRLIQEFHARNVAVTEKELPNESSSLQLLAALIRHAIKWDAIPLTIRITWHQGMQMFTQPTMFKDPPGTVSLPVGVHLEVVPIIPGTTRDAAAAFAAAHEAACREAQTEAINATAWYAASLLKLAESAGADSEYTVCESLRFDGTPVNVDLRFELLRDDGWQASLARPLNWPLLLRGLAGWKSEVKAFADVQYLWRATHLCVGSNPTVGFVTQRGVFPALGVEQQPGQFGIAVNMETQTIAWSFHGEENGRRRKSHDVKATDPLTNCKWDKLTMVTALRLCVNQEKGKVMLVIPSGDTRVIEIPRLSKVNVPLFLAAELRAGGIMVGGASTKAFDGCVEACRATESFTAGLRRSREPRKTSRVKAQKKATRDEAVGHVKWHSLQPGSAGWCGGLWRRCSPEFRQALEYSVLLRNVPIVRRPPPFSSQRRSVPARSVSTSSVVARGLSSFKRLPAARRSLQPQSPASEENEFLVPPAKRGRGRPCKRLDDGDWYPR